MAEACPIVVIVRRLSVDDVVLILYDALEYELITSLPAFILFLM